jgi:hypothetical protein
MQLLTNCFDTVVSVFVECVRLCNFVSFEGPFILHAYAFSLESAFASGLARFPPRPPVGDSFRVRRFSAQGCDCFSFCWRLCCKASHGFRHILLYIVEFIVQLGWCQSNRVGEKYSNVAQEIRLLKKGEKASASSTSRSSFPRMLLPLELSLRVDTTSAHMVQFRDKKVS